MKRRSFLGLLAFAVPIAKAAATVVEQKPTVAEELNRVAWAGPIPDPLRVKFNRQIQCYGAISYYPAELIFECRPEDLRYIN